MPPSDSARRASSRYVLGDLLGRGGMAEVFAGHAVGDHGFQKPVAIKRLLPELANDEVFVERLIEEAKLLVGMQHGNIVSVLDLAREGDDVFLVMEYVDGPSLRQLIKARGSLGLSLGVATYIVQAAAAGLEFAHARPGGAIIHADISPSNLLLTTSGEVRVADFGIARREGYGQGVVEGKWAYMAPEQARGEPLSPHSDVFALGVVLYELLTGRHPFGSAVTADERDDRMRVIAPRTVKASVPHGIDAICMRALAHDPRKRYGRMQQLIDALVEERFANGYREGASDLAQAIREVAPGADGGSPRTMHTSRPVTIMTRSLLREVTPVRRPSRPSRPSLPPPSRLAPIDAPEAPHPTSKAIGTPLPRARHTVDLTGENPRARHSLIDATVEPSRPPSRAAGATTPHARHAPIDATGQIPRPRHSPIDVPAEAFPPQPTSAVQTRAVGLDEPSHDGFVTQPGSGAQTIARVVDPNLARELEGPSELSGPAAAIPSSGANTVAREVDQVALAAAAQAASALLQLPPMLRADGTPMPPFRLPVAVPGDELASVVGGNTLTGHGAGVAVEPAAVRRWTLFVLAAATLIGVISAIIITLSPDGAGEAASIESSAIAAPGRPSSAPVAMTVERVPPAVTPIEVTPSPPPPEPAPVPSVQPAGAQPAPAAAAAEPGTAATPPEAPSARQPGPPVAGAEAPAAPEVPDVREPSPPAEVATRQRPGKSRSARPSSRDSKAAKAEPGILQVQSHPWSWVTIRNQTKETPDKFYLQPGVHVAKFYCEETGVTKVESITIKSGERLRLDLDMSR